eukprot:TRINITY_DN27643_c0_g1_i1.p1 TRINITY_DN27643_c0_g1~~TRINITY_DN27643_c0_g1_i1.p1  ORF type:complete len:620 (-),score=150.30 TRINITY_DN27643_c0_g1_i1:315-2174(-)
MSGGAWAELNPKIKLNGVVQKKTGRAVLRNDVQYQTEKDLFDLHTTTLTIQSLGIIVQSPVPLPTQMESEKSAAAQALLELAADGEDIGEIPGPRAPPNPAAGEVVMKEPDPKMVKMSGAIAKSSAPTPPMMVPPAQAPGPMTQIAELAAKRKAAGMNMQAAEAQILAFDSVTFSGPFGMLKQLVQEALQRPFSNSDMVVNVTQEPAGYRATVQIPALGIDARGSCTPKREDAEKTASAVCCRKVQEKCFKNTPVLRTENKVGPPVFSGGRATGGAPQPRLGEDLVRAAGQQSVMLGGKIDDPITDIYEELQDWREMRMEPPSQGEELPDSTSIDYWYGQICLVCLCTVSRVAWMPHARGEAHKKRHKTLNVRKRREAPRPSTAPACTKLGATQFKRIAGWHCPRDSDPRKAPSILLLGEMDFSLAWQVAKMRPRGAPMIATTHLREHDPNEPEVYPKDDTERAKYRRISLPSMKGASAENIKKLTGHGARIKYKVDATNMEGSLRGAGGVEGGFANIIFGFPRASLQRACDPRNSRLLRNFFLSARQHAFLLPGGMIQLILLGTQYEEWDVACMAADAGMYLADRVELPDDFYTPREVSGKSWSPIGAELMNFRVQGE